MIFPILKYGKKDYSNTFFINLILFLLMFLYKLRSYVGNYLYYEYYRKYMTKRPQNKIFTVENTIVIIGHIVKKRFPLCWN